jgi:hypothetical protein
MMISPSDVTYPCRSLRPRRAEAEAVGRLLHGLIAETVAVVGRREGWAVGHCHYCRGEVWLSSGSLDLLAGDPDVGVFCVDCGCALLGR